MASHNPDDDMSGPVDALRATVITIVFMSAEDFEDVIPDRVLEFVGWNIENPFTAFVWWLMAILWVTALL